MSAGVGTTNSTPRIAVWHFTSAAILGIVPIALFCLRLSSDVALQAVAVAILFACAAVLSGGLLGFLFGIPRTLQDGGESLAARPTPDTSGPSDSRASQPNGFLVGPNYRVNTNLEQISDWLTKILVGVGLTQVTAIRDAGSEIIAAMAAGLGNGAAATALAATMLVYFTIFGFLSGYLWTRLFLATELRRADRADVLRLEGELVQTKREVAILQEVSPVVINRSSDQAPAPASTPSRRALAVHANDPQKGLWGGKREANFRAVKAGTIRALRSDPDFFRIPLEVWSTDSSGHPLTGLVRFHLHDTFEPQVEEVEAVGGVARLELVAYGAFTVGIEGEDGTKLEIDLSDPDIDAPKKFKDS